MVSGFPMFLKRGFLLLGLNVTYVTKIIVIHEVLFRAISRKIHCVKSIWNKGQPIFIHIYFLLKGCTVALSQQRRCISPASTWAALLIPILTLFQEFPCQFACKLYAINIHIYNNHQQRPYHKYLTREIGQASIVTSDWGLVCDFRCLHFTQ